MSREIKRWITVNGAHIPIYEGEDNGDALDRAFGRKSIKVNDVDVNVSKRKKRVDQKDLTNERIMSEIAGEDNYYSSEEYQKILSDRGEILKKRQELFQKRQQLDEEILKESTIKPESEWDEEDEYTALMEGKRNVRNYTERGLKLKEERQIISKEAMQADHEFTELNDRDEEFTKEQAWKQRSQYLMRDDPSSSSNVKDDYFGFSKKTTVGEIDKSLEIGDGYAEIVEMTPKRYIQEVAYRIFESGTIEAALMGRKATDVAKYMTMMEQGVKFDMPYLNYNQSKQEGIHRALAAYFLGIEAMPVAIIRRKR